MNDLKTDILIIGGGPGGLAAAVKAWDLGVKDIILMEREDFLGGILPQCIHNGFGLFEFNKEMTGPEYSQLFIDKLKKTKVSLLLSTMALRIERDRSVIYTSKKSGIQRITPKVIILSLGCRERTRGQIMLPGTRPAGIFTAGVVQRMVNIEGYLPGNDIVILGSGDIGLIMARRLHLEGCDVKGVYELMPYSAGLTRNIFQCLRDYDIPLFLSHTVTNIHGKKRLEALEVDKVDKRSKPVGRPERINCDTLLLSVGLICENELTKTAGILIDRATGGPFVDQSYMTSKNGVFACGNSLFVNDIVDNVSEIAYEAAKGAYNYIHNGKNLEDRMFPVEPGDNVAYVVPQRINMKSDIKLYIRPSRPVKSPRLEFSGVDFTKNLRYVVPGELLQVSLKKNSFIKEVDRIKVSIKQR